MKIKTDFVVGEVKEIRPQIFAVVVKDMYQRAMLFCRYQEFYESPYSEIRGKFFTWEKFMMIYRTRRKENVFTYPYDWSGYNIPSTVIEKAIDKFERDSGPYDEVMKKIWYHCENYPLKFEKPRKKWYLIGADTFKSNTMDHEIAHGLYYTNKEYKKNCDYLTSNIKPTHYERIRKKLVSMGYVNEKKIIYDEIQAYLSTGLGSLETLGIKMYEDDFINNFEEFNK